MELLKVRAELPSIPMSKIECHAHVDRSSIRLEVVPQSADISTHTLAAAATPTEKVRVSFQFDSSVPCTVRMYSNLSHSDVDRVLSLASSKEAGPKSAEDKEVQSGFVTRR
jgi:hypothetical protein